MSGETNDGGTSPDSNNISTNSSPTHEPELNQAFAEAEAAIDTHSQHSQPSVEVAGEQTSAEEAVSEAMIQAKNELEEALEQTRKEAAQLKDRWMRAAADLENLRRRAAKEREDVQKFGTERLLKNFLPVMDDLDRAVQVLDGHTEAETSATTKQLLGGVQMVQKKFLATLEKHGVTSFDAKGTPFNPERHEAVQQIHSEHEVGAVASELQRGFLIHDRLLRPALVVVSLGPEGSETVREGSE
ncbi:MAG: nucleotide exchange factor GrpE [Myxococcales bacterium]|nr:nucleotide exchange factor GrpE [Myxococcales bacterium]